MGLRFVPKLPSLTNAQVSPKFPHGGKSSWGRISAYWPRSSGKQTNHPPLNEYIGEELRCSPPKA